MGCNGPGWLQWGHLNWSDLSSSYLTTRTENAWMCHIIGVVVVIQDLPQVNIQKLMWIVLNTILRDLFCLEFDSHMVGSLQMPVDMWTDTQEDWWIRLVMNSVSQSLRAWEIIHKMESRNKASE